MSGVERGAQRAREAMDTQSLGDGDVGLKLMRHVAPQLIKAIEAAQAEAQEGLANAGRGRPVHWWWLILSLPADKLAVVTLKAVFNEKPREFTFHMPVSSVAAK